MLPQALLDSLEKAPGFQRDPFVQVHEAGEPPVSIRLQQAKFGPAELMEYDRLSVAGPVPWCSSGYYLQRRPSFTFDPLFHAGCYYVQEASSMALEAALRQHAPLDSPLLALDLCAAPGGKSTHLLSLLSPGSLLVSNEVIRTRATVLRGNLERWGDERSVVTSSDPAALGRLEGLFDLMVVDAPCSGSGLFRRDPEAVKEWSPEAVALCSARQQRILADIWPALKEGGLLFYSTCSYSEAEDEAVAAWLSEGWGAETLPVQFPEEWGIVPVQTGGVYGYRFYPDRVKGEGFFFSLLRKTEGGSTPRMKGRPPERAGAPDRELLKNWVRLDGCGVYRHGAELLLFPQAWEGTLGALQGGAYLVAAGTRLGTPMRGKLIPHHALALSTRLGDVPRTDLDYASSILYLQRNDALRVEGAEGWGAVTFRGHPLGWMNALKHRVNNYYPKELRILKRSDDTALEN